MIYVRMDRNHPTHCTYANTPIHLHRHPHLHRHAHTHTPAQTHTLAQTHPHGHTPAHTDSPTSTHLHRHLLKQSLYCCEATSKGTKTHFKFQFGNEEGGCFSLPGNTKQFT